MMKKISKILLYIYIILLILGGIDIIFTSFRQNYPYPNLIKANYSLRSYSYLLKEMKLRTGTINSFIIGIGSSIFSLILAYPIAKKIYDKDKNYKAINFLVFLPFLIAATTIGLGLQTFLLSIGIKNSKIVIGLVQSIYIIPYCVRIIKPGFGFLSDNILSSAYMLGANQKDVIKNIAIPIMAPFIKTAFIMGFVLSVSQYYITLVLGSGLVDTFITVAFPFFASRDRAISSALIILFLLINIFLILFVELIFRLIFRRKKWQI